MPIAAKVAELLLTIRKQDLEQLSPAERRRLADLCRHVAGFADVEDDPPKPDALHEPAAGRRDE
jgi:hypothetical protein